MVPGFQWSRLWPVFEKLSEFMKTVQILCLQAVTEMVCQCQDELFPNSSQDLCSWMLMEPAGLSFVLDNKDDEPCVVIHSRERASLSIAK